MTTTLYITYMNGIAHVRITCPNPNWTRETTRTPITSSLLCIAPLINCSCSPSAVARKEYVMLSQPDRVVLLAVIPAPPQLGVPGRAPPTATFRLLVQQAYLSGSTTDMEDVDTVEDVTCRVQVDEMRRGGGEAVDRTLARLLDGLENPMLRPEVEPEIGKAAARVQARCADPALGDVQFRLRVVLIDTFDDESEYEEQESFLDYEAAEGSWDDDDGWEQHESGDEDEDDDASSQFVVRPYSGISDQNSATALAGFEARSDGPELGDQLELTPRDMERIVRLALEGGRLEDDEAYRRGLIGGAPVSRVSLAALLDQALRGGRGRQDGADSSGGLHGGNPGAVPASPESVAGLERLLYSENNGDGGHATACGICLEAFAHGVALRRMPCAHAFHESCLGGWLRFSRICPVCRFALPADVQEQHECQSPPAKL